MLSSRCYSDKIVPQILSHTQQETDRKQIASAQKAVETVLDHINESIREQEGYARLKAISKDLWIGQGCAYSS